MLDKNGKNIHTGDIVLVQNSYFKNDNGYYFVTASPGDPTWCGTDYSLCKIGKRGKISTAKYRIAFWPLKAFTSDRWKNAEAREHNKAHATIEIVNDIPKGEVAAYFLEEAHRNEEQARDYEWRFGAGNRTSVIAWKCAEFRRKVAARIS